MTLSVARLVVSWLAVVLLFNVAEASAVSLQQQEGDSVDFSAVVRGNNAFAFDLYRAAAANAEGENLVFSPYSVAQALAMVYAGARGDTEAEIASVMQIALPQDEWHPLMGALNADLTEREYNFPVMSEDEIPPQAFELNVANALWGQADYAFTPDYLDLLTRSYRVGLELVDFRADAAAARERINEWVAENTEDRITDIVPEGAINDGTRLILANAIYFKAAWLDQFNPQRTSEAAFTRLDGTEIEVPTMVQQTTLPRSAGDGYQAVMMPYIGSDVGMVFIVPDDLAAFEAELDAEQFDAVIADMSSTGETILYLPRFRVESSVMLGDVLQQMGMESVFSAGQANFGGMSQPGAEPLFVDRALHKAFIDVNEEGTEAAAATLMMVGATSAPVEVTEFRVDRPFIYAIYDRRTGSVLFLGRVLDPSE